MFGNVCYVQKVDILNTTCKKTAHLAHRLILAVEY